MAVSSAQFRLLGPVEAVSEAGTIALGPPQRRAVLALLLLADCRAVTVAVLRERLWGPAAPASAVAALHVHVHHLRRALEGGGARVVTHPGHPSANVSYALDADPAYVDVRRFTDLADLGERAHAKGAAEDAVDAIDRALDLWRGEPLGRVPSSPYLDSARHSLLDARLDARKRRAAALLGLGAASRALHDLRQLHEEHPDDERVVVLLTTALHTTGATARALDLLTGALRWWEREHGAPPPALRQHRDRLLDGAPGRAP